MTEHSPAPYTCIRCGKGHDRAGQRWCRDCHAAYMRDWRAAHPRLTEAFRRKAADALARAVEVEAHP